MSLALLLVMTACGSQGGPEEDRRFANDPATDIPAEPTQPSIAPDGVLVTEEVPTALPPDAAQGLLEAEGAPAGVMIRDGDVVMVVDPSRPGERAIVTFDETGSMLDFAPSPSGGRVVGLVRTPAGDLVVELRNTRDEVIDRWQIDEPNADVASPVPENDGVEAGFAVTWTGSKDRVLVTVGGDRLVNVDFENGPQEIAIPSGFGSLFDASWSPIGDRIAMFGVGFSGAGTIWTISPYVDGDSFRQVMPLAADAADLGSVTRYAWLPDGSGLLYILAQDTSEAHPGGNLYRIDLTTRQRQVVATPGRGGPSAQIVDFMVSPDGASVAYMVANPRPDVWEYHSLWLRSLNSVLYLAVDTGYVSEVTGMWWVGSGFAWETPSTDGNQLVFQDRRTGPAVIWSPSDASIATPMATPAMDGEATPVPIPDATPNATPMASPVASPIASPIATPDN